MNIINGRDRDHHTFPRPLKEEPHNENLQSRHRNHQCTFCNAEVKNPVLRALDRAHVPVLPRPEVFLVPVDGGEIAGDFEDGFFERGGLFGGRALFAGELGIAGFVLDLSEAGPVSDLCAENQPGAWSEIAGTGERRPSKRAPYRDLEIHHLLCKSAHLVVEAKSILSLLFRREDEIALSFFDALHYYLFVGTDHAVVDIE